MVRVEDEGGEGRERERRKGARVLDVVLGKNANAKQHTKRTGVLFLAIMALKKRKTSDSSKIFVTLFAKTSRNINLS